MRGVHENKAVPMVRRSAAALQMAFDNATDGESRDQGASMVEYALLLILVLLVAFVSVQVFGETIVELFGTSANTLENAPNVNP